MRALIWSGLAAALVVGLVAGAQDAPSGGVSSGGTTDVTKVLKTGDSMTGGLSVVSSDGGYDVRAERNPIYSGVVDGGAAVVVRQGGNVWFDTSGDRRIYYNGTDMLFRVGSYGDSLKLNASGGNAVFPYGAQFGTGYIMGGFYAQNQVIDFPAITSACQNSTNITVTNAAVQDTCTVSVNGAWPSTNSVFTCQVTAANTVVVRHCSPSTADDPTSATFTVRIIGH